MKYVRKRDGRLDPFDQKRITNAIWKAAKAVGGRDSELAKKLSDEVVVQLEKRFGEEGVPTVEEIQDLVEKTLIENGHARTAKAYILYRKQHQDMRELAALLSSSDLVDQYLEVEDWRVRENSNMSYSLQGLNNYLSSTVIAKYWITRIYPTRIADAHYSGDLHIHDLGVLGPYCFDDQTRVLTREGFKLFRDVTLQDEVATYNLETGYLEYQHPTDRQVFEYSSSLLSFENRSISLRVTPEHRLLVRERNSDKWKFVTPTHFKSRSEFLKRAKWKGKETEFFEVPKVEGGNRLRHLKKIPIGIYLKFMGWYLAEGNAWIHHRKDRNSPDYIISIGQRNRQNRAKIASLIKELGFSPNLSEKDHIQFHSKELCLYLKRFGTSSEKFVPKFIKNLSSRLIEIFLFSFFEGDGTIENGKLRRFSTTSRRLAEDGLECLLKIRKSGTMRWDGRRFCVSVQEKQLTPLYNEHPKLVPYKGKVYDLTVPNGTLIVERNGKVVVSGNCVGWDLRELLLSGFGGVSGKVESTPAKHFRTALGQVVNFFYTLQGEAAGAQAFSNFDSYLAPFIRYDELSQKEVKQALQEFLFNINVPTRVGFQCLSEDTEILTAEGWKSFQDIKKGDLIKTFNLKNGGIENQRVTTVFKRYYEGPMYRLENRIQDQLLSPGHRVVRRKFQSDKHVLEPVEKVCSLKSPFIIPIAGRNIRGDVGIYDDQIRLMAWIISEGSVEHPGKHRCCYRVSIYQSKKKNRENYEEIIGLLKKFGLKYSEYETASLGDKVARVRLNAESSRKIHDWFGTKEKVHFIPSKLLNLSERQSRLFLETYLKANGFENSKIATSSSEILDALQIIAVNGGFGFTTLKREATIGSKDIYVLRLIRHKETYIQKVEKVNYKGIIWCPHTENETVVARRKGKVFITGNTPFTNVTLDLTVPDFMRDEPVLFAGKVMDETYGDMQEEMEMFNTAFAEMMIEGDAKGRVFTFPIPTYNVTKDFSWESPSAQKLFETAAKYGVPYFSNFVNSDMKPEDVRSMCCRLRIDNRELRKRGGGFFGANPLTGSIGVVTLNLPRIGYLAKDEEEFFERLGELMEIAKDSLEIKRKALEQFTEEGLYPYSRYYLHFIKESFGKYWKNHFSTIGLIGMNEAALNLFGYGIATSEGLGFAIRVLSFMRGRLSDFQEETGSIYNLEATPAEGTSYRLARIDKRKYPDIIVANEKNVSDGAEPFYTNSSQLPVDYDGDLFEALEHQDRLQTLYTGGTVFHIYLGEKLYSWRAAAEIVKKVAWNAHLPYFTLTPTFSICPTHGYLSGEQRRCPICGAKCEVYSRVVGYLRPVDQWNDGKQAEFSMRKTFDKSVTFATVPAQVKTQ